MCLVEYGFWFESTPMAILPSSFAGLIHTDLPPRGYHQAASKYNICAFRELLLASSALSFGSLNATNSAKQ